MQTAAHQLKSPLAMVQTLANLIRDGIVTDQTDILTTCDKIVRRSREGIGQVTELLALARVQEADPRRHQESHSDVGKLVDELCRKNQPVAEEKNITMTWQIPEDENLTVQVHSADLTDCIGNLIENAVKYTPDDGSVKVTVICGQRHQAPGRPESGSSDKRRPEDYIFVIVRDTGIGIDEDMLGTGEGDDSRGSLFDAFRRGNTALAAGIPGTGLGLSIVREVVEQAGGFIHVHSSPGEGSTFTVSLPRRQRSPDGPVRDTRSSEIVVERSSAATDEQAKPPPPRQCRLSYRAASPFGGIFFLDARLVTVLCCATNRSMKWGNVLSQRQPRQVQSSL